MRGDVSGWRTEIGRGSAVAAMGALGRAVVVHH